MKHRQYVVYPFKVWIIVWRSMAPQAGLWVSKNINASMTICVETLSNFKNIKTQDLNYMKHIASYD